MKRQYALAGTAAVVAAVAFGLSHPSNQTTVSSNTPVAAAYPDPNDAPCTIKTVSNIDANRILSYGPLCRSPREQRYASNLFKVEGIDVSLGRSARDVESNARDVHAKVSKYSGEIRIDLDRSVPNTKPDGSPAPEFPPWNQHTKLVLALTSGRVVGIYTCQDFVSGDYQNRLNVYAVEAFGLPTDTSSDGQSITLSWGGKASMLISGAPNFARLQIGLEPRSIKHQNVELYRSVFDELTSLQDRGDSEGAKTQIAVKYCITEHELENIIVPQLESGRQPREP